MLVIPCALMENKRQWGLIGGVAIISGTLVYLFANYRVIWAEAWQKLLDRRIDIGASIIANLVSA
jgi:hypothetical protein